MSAITEQIREIAKRMARKIPRPQLPPLKPQKSFAGLQKGQKLRLVDGQRVFTPGTGSIRRGALLQVTDCTNRWAEITVVEDLTGSAEVGTKLLWDSREWQRTFEKAGRR